MSYSYSTTPLYVREGDFIQFRFKAPPQWDYSETITITLGDLVQYWVITTIPEDFTPDPFPLQKVDKADLDTLYTYADGTRTGEEIITVTGLTPTTQAAVAISSNIVVPTDPNTDRTQYYAMRIDYDGNGTWDTPWIQPSSTTQGYTVENGAKIQIRGRTKSGNIQESRITLVIGTSNEVWRITTKSVPLNSPEPFPVFDNLNGQPTNTYVYSNIIRIQGLTEDAFVSLDNNGEFAISDSNTTTTNGDGFDVLSGATFNTSPTSVSNGQYLQLRVLSSANPNTPLSTSLSIGDTANGSAWQVTTGANPSTTPNSFLFPDVTDAIEDFLVASETRPLGGIQGLGTGVTVPVELVSTTASDVRVKINNGSIGVFPTNVENGDTITIYAQSSTSFSTTVETQIRVGNRTIPTWQVTTNSGPDTDAIFNVPTSRTNVVPGDYITSSVVTVEGINRPITISATNGALISIDYDTPIAGPRTFDPKQNSTFYLVLQAPGNLLTTETTSVTVGTGTLNNPFTWSVTTYATVPPPATNLGVWYSKKTEKFDGYPIGTVLPVLKEGVNGYGDLSGDLGSRYAGFIECDGSSLSAAQFFALFDVIGNTYGGNGSYDLTTNTYTGDFKVPDYRNRRLVGTGFVDSSRGNSAFVPVYTVGKGIFDVGGEGGYWYFDKVDVSGSVPLEQVEGTGPSGIDSLFFSLGTVRVDGLETVTDSITFNITGQVSGLIGPIGEVLVQVPVHDHLYVSAVVESDSGDPLNPWQPDGRALFAVSAGPYGDPDALYWTQDNVGPSGSASHETPAAEQEAIAAGLWATFLSNVVGPAFMDELRAYSPDIADTFIENLPWTPVSPRGNVNTAQETYSFLTYWISPASATDSVVAAGLFDDVDLTIGPSPLNREVTAVIDTNQAIFTVNTYTPPTDSLQTNTHSHYITLSPVENIQTDFSGGNVSGAGIIGSPYGSGLGGASTTIQLEFTQDEIFMDMSDGTFELSSSFKKPVPDVSLAPQRQVPILNPFHKTKYVIKAY